MIKTMTRSTSVGSAFNKGFAIYKENFVLIFLTTLVAAIIGAVTCSICAGPMQCGLIGIVLSLLRKQDPKPEFGKLFDGFQKFVPAFVTYLALSVISVVLCLIPILGAIISFIVIPTVMVWAMFLIQDQDATIGEAISTPLKLLGDKSFWMVILIGFIGGLIAAVGAIACGIGVFFTAPIFICMLAAAYEEVYGEQQDEPAAAPVAENQP